MTTEEICLENSNLQSQVANDVVDLRRNHGLTVRLPLVAGGSRFSSGCRSKSKFQSSFHLDSEHLWSSCPVKLPETKSQLASYCARTVPTLGGKAATEGSRGCNYRYWRSSLSFAIRQHMSSLSFNSTKLLHFTAGKAAMLLTVILLFSLQAASVSALSESSSPLIRTDATSENTFGVFDGRRSRRTSGNLDLQTLKIIPEWGELKDTLLLSGRDYIYMFNASTLPSRGRLTNVKQLKWNSTVQQQNRCLHMGKSKFECSNFIRVAEVQEDGHLYVCGTNSYEPKCRRYSRRSFSVPTASSNSPHVAGGECNRQCPCPFNPTKSSVAVYSNTSTGSHLFSAVIDNFMATNPVLMRKSDPPIYSMNKWFDDPTFVKLVEARNGKMYLFFRETASTVETGNAPSTYGRIAQVCKNDKGGRTLLEGQWTSFLKARLKCSIPGSGVDTGFAFNNLTSVSDITTTTGPDGRLIDVIFVTFTTPWNWKAVSMSAVCVYSVASIENLFDNGDFLAIQAMRVDPSSSSTSMETVLQAVPVSGSEVPTPRPGKCLVDTTEVSDKTLHFAKEHFLMYEPVSPMFNKPIFMSEQNVRATQIVVDSNNASDPIVAYIGTENGKVLRLRPNLQQAEESKSLLLEEMSVADSEDCSSGRKPCSILSMNLYRSLSSPKSEPGLFVAFTDRLVRVHLSNCSQYATLECCNVDPVCGWLDGRCLPRSSHRNRQFPATSPIRNVPSNCQRPKSRSCGHSEILSYMKELCLNPSSTQNKSKKKGRHSQGSSRRSATDDPVVSARSVHTSVSGRSVNDQTGTSTTPITINRRGCATIRGEIDAESGDPNEEITGLFIKHVLPSISTEFSETMQLLTDSDRRSALFLQLRTAMVETTRMVLKNHKMDHCLPNQTINSLTHTYPLLLREIENWHELALRKMRPISRLECWENPQSPCSARVSFSMSFAPTLWEPLTNFIQEFGGVCSTVPPPADREADAGSCHALPGARPCRDRRQENSSLCQVRKCRFSDYAVDVKSLFRHANDSRNFLPIASGNEPFRKPAVLNLPGGRVLRSHFELLVGNGNPFQLFYYPKTEKVKIIFHYSQIIDRTEISCNSKLEKKLNNWFKNFMAKLTPSSLTCKGQIRRAAEDNRGAISQHIRQRRSVEDNRAVVAPRKCMYMKKSFHIKPRLWLELVDRAQDSGARYSNSSRSLTFYRRTDVVRFFRQRCSGAPSWSDDYRNMKRSVARRRQRGRVKKVQVFVSRTMPFVIERTAERKFRIRYFTTVVR